MLSLVHPCTGTTGGCAWPSDSHELSYHHGGMKLPAYRRLHCDSRTTQQLSAPLAWCSILTRWFCGDLSAERSRHLREHLVLQLRHSFRNQGMELSGSGEGLAV